MAFPTSWNDPQFLVAVTGVLAVGAIAVALNATGEFSPPLFGLAVLGVTVIGSVALAVADRLD